MMVDLDRLGQWLRRGASLVLNDIDRLTPGLNAVARALEEALGAKVQANLYCSWKAHQAFGSHFDTHDVYALHIAGEKTWNLYGRHFEDPIAHPRFKTLGQAFHDAHKGALSQQVTLRPGDVLYIPRGWYHDALASSEATVHIAFGATPAIGLDLISLLFEHSVDDPLFRARVPPPDADGGQALAAHLARLGDRLAEFARSPELVAAFRAFQRSFRYPRDALTLPDDALMPRWRRLNAALRMTRRGTAWWLGDGIKAAPIPDGLDRPVAWVLGREGFTQAEFAAAFPDLSPEARRKLLADLTKMRVIGPA